MGIAAQLSVTTPPDKQTHATPRDQASDNTRRRLRVGLTGGIASGKTMVSRHLGELGAGIVDTDEISRDVVATGTPGLGQVVAAFGSGVLTDNGTLNRAALRKRIFSNPDDKARLEAILHPLIRAQALEQADNVVGDYVVFVVPLLLETNFAALVDRILVVDCPPEIQQQRLMQRDNESQKSAARAIANQIGPARRVELADDVIDNSGTLAELFAAVDTIHLRYLKLAKSAPKRSG
jgi:dephospho-CoA kinase